MRTITRKIKLSELILELENAEIIPAYPNQLFNSHWVLHLNLLEEKAFKSGLLGLILNDFELPTLTIHTGDDEVYVPQIHTEKSYNLALNLYSIRKSNLFTSLDDQFKQKFENTYITINCYTEMTPEQWSYYINSTML